MMLDDATIDAIARRVWELQQEAAPAVSVMQTDEVLTLGEARVYVKRPSKRAFYLWCKRWGVEAKAHGRYGRAALDLALARESGAVRTPAVLRREQEAMQSQQRRVA